MQIQISWFLQKPTDLDLDCLQRQGVFGFNRTRVNKMNWFKFLDKYGEDLSCQNIIRVNIW